MEKIKKFVKDTYNYTFHIIKTDNINRSRSKLDRVLDSVWKYDSSVGGLHSHRKEYPESYIFLHPNSKIGLICHECLHGIMDMFEYIGAKDVDEEIMAYQLEELVNEVNKFINNGK